MTHHFSVHVHVKGKSANNFRFYPSGLLHSSYFSTFLLCHGSLSCAFCRDFFFSSHRGCQAPALWGVTGCRGIHRNRKPGFLSQFWNTKTCFLSTEIKPVRASSGQAHYLSSSPGGGRNYRISCLGDKCEITYSIYKPSEWKRSFSCCSYCTYRGAALDLMLQENSGPQDKVTKPRQVAQTRLHLRPQLGGHPIPKSKVPEWMPHRDLLLHLQERHWEWKQRRKLPVPQYLPLQVSQMDTVMMTLAKTRWEAHLAAKEQLCKALLERSLSFKGSLQAWIQPQGTDLSSSPLTALVSPGASRMPAPKRPALKLPGESKWRIFSCLLCTAYFPVSSVIIG